MCIRDRTQSTWGNLPNRFKVNDAYKRQVESLKNPQHFVNQERHCISMNHPPYLSNLHENMELDCMVCLSPWEPNQPSYAPCKCSICTDCMIKWIVSQIEDITFDLTHYFKCPLSLIHI
eukprot:TRINITY_DN29894_c0_g1_i1.p1 TRINITY_DN29894_c0_g1~~TRINITY_DN29894_c0_g1_i1.p1  ORF type:complete len:139 (-),score=27.14 TRINITY_DN29894_c0_g1_i1:60-416(-)